HTTTGCGKQGFPSAQPYLSHTPGANPFCCMFFFPDADVVFFLPLVEGRWQMYFPFSKINNSCHALQTPYHHEGSVAPARRIPESPVSVGGSRTGKAHPTCTDRSIDVSIVED
ncbi:hypothetical protein BO72DRAFT_393150, partial [Aspergillus fijiensis CBS 313.89]